MSGRWWLVMVLCAGCRVDFDDLTLEPACERIVAECNAASASEIGPMLDADTVSSCDATARANREDACEQVADACASECGQARRVAAESEVFLKCWEQAGGAQRFCFDFTCGGQADCHNYEWWIPYGGTAATHMGMFDIFGNLARPGVLELYGIDADTRACFSIWSRGTELFVSAEASFPTEGSTDCTDGLTDEQIGPAVARLVSVAY